MAKYKKYEAYKKIRKPVPKSGYSFKSKKRYTRNKFEEYKIIQEELENEN